MQAASEKSVFLKDKKNKFENTQPLQRHSGAIMSVAELLNGNVISGSSDKTIKVWDIATGQCLSTLQEHSDFVMSVAMLPNGNVISGSWDYTLKVWDIATGQCVSQQFSVNTIYTALYAIPRYSRL